MLSTCCVKGLVLLSCGMKEVVVFVSVCVAGWLWQAVGERVMRLLGWLLVGCSMQGNSFCVFLRRCCWHIIWLRFLFWVVCGRADCVCRARFAGWFCGGAASWVRSRCKFIMILILMLEAMLTSMSWLSCWNLPRSFSCLLCFSGWDHLFVFLSTLRWQTSFPKLLSACIPFCSGWAQQQDPCSLSFMRHISSASGSSIYYAPVATNKQGSRKNLPTPRHVTILNQKWDIWRNKRGNKYFAQRIENKYIIVQYEIKCSSKQKDGCQ